LLDLTAMALAENPSLSNVSGFVEDSGEGRWTIMAAIEEAVPAEVLSASLYTRFRIDQRTCSRSSPTSLSAVAVS
jgi:6-phosphogluconate dehydrogenase